jgi:nitroreductase
MFGAFMALLMTSCYNGNSNDKVTSSPSFDEVLTSRRSVRNYDASKKITEAEVRDLIKAAQEAPSWANQQPTKYYVAISEEKLAAVQDMVGGNKERINNGLSNCYLILKARAMGFDTLIMGMREADKLRELFAIPEGETIMAVIALGYRAEEPNRPERKNLDEIVKFF